MKEGKIKIQRTQNASLEKSKSSNSLLADGLLKNNSLLSSENNLLNNSSANATSDAKADIPTPNQESVSDIIDESPITAIENKEAIALETIPRSPEEDPNFLALTTKTQQASCLLYTSDAADE